MQNLRELHLAVSHSSIYKRRNRETWKRKTKKVKKGIDKRGRIWYSNKAVRHGRRRAKGKWKKLLTAMLKCGNLNKLPRIRDGPGVKNFWKKFLTNGMKSSIIAMFRRERRAPCKLNNVTKRKHQRASSFRGTRQRKIALAGLSQLPAGAKKWSYGK